MAEPNEINPNSGVDCAVGANLDTHHFLRSDDHPPICNKILSDSAGMGLKHHFREQRAEESAKSVGENI